MALQRTATELLGEVGHDWIDELPAIVAGCAERWSLRIDPPFAGLSYNYTAPAVRADGTAAVLKICLPGAEFVTEAEALRVFAGHGAVRLLEVEMTDRALLLERLEPGTPLSMVTDDAEAMSAAAAVQRQLWRPVPNQHPFPSVADWAGGFQRLRQRFDGGTGPLPVPLVQRAEQLFAELLDSMAEPVVLHGDLHHGNVLAACRERWLAIDPKGVIGEPAYETGALLRNPLPELLAEPQPRRLLARRADQLADELGFDRKRVLDWAVAQAVLSACWTLEDHGHGWEPMIACTELLAGIKR